MGRSTVYNDYLTKDWEHVGSRNKKIVKEFIQYCKSNDKSPQTIYQYEEWLKVFFCWNYRENEDKFYIDLKKRDFVNYFGYLRDLGHSPNRIASLKSALSSLSNEIELMYEDLYPNFKNQLRGLEAVHITTVREKTVLSNDDIDKILEKLINNGSYQTACYLALLCSSGSRKAEMIQMKTSFFTEEHEVFEGYMYKTPKIRAKGRGKRGKMISKYVIKPFFKPYLDKWLEERAEKDIQSEYLFVAKEKGEYIPATISTANAFAREISKILDGDFYNHCARHYFCTLLKSMKLPDDIIVEIFQWSDSSMVKVYDDTPMDAKLNQWFGKDGVKPQ